MFPSPSAKRDTTSGVGIEHGIYVRDRCKTSIIYHERANFDILDSVHGRGEIFHARDGSQSRARIMDPAMRIDMRTLRTSDPVCDSEAFPPLENRPIFGFESEIYMRGMTEERCMVIILWNIPTSIKHRTMIKYPARLLHARHETSKTLPLMAAAASRAYNLPISLLSPGS